MSLVLERTLTRAKEDYPKEDYEKADIEKIGDDASVVDDPAFEKRTMRKVDLRVLPILGILYSVALVDRINLSLARQVGADHALGLNIGSRYTIAAVAFFIPYIILELPSNLFLRHVGPNLWLGTISLLWGAVMLGMGFVKNWHQLTACRVLLGVLESGFFPGCSYLISLWYTRREVQTRLAFFYLFSVVMSGFSSILSYGFYKMGGLGNVAGWRWIFIMCGILTCVLSIVGFLTIVGFPDQNTFLTPAETALVLARVHRDRGDSKYDPMTFAKARKYAVDLKLWAFGLMFMCAAMPAYALAYFLPQILGGMGYGTKKVLLLNAPPYLVGSVVALAISWYADRVNKRALFIILQAIMTIIGLLMVMYSHNNAVRYTGVFFGLSGAAGEVPAVLAYQANNIIGQSKRAFSSALVIGFGGVGGIFATTAFRQQDFPDYRNGMWAAVGCQFLMIVLAILTTIQFYLANRAVQKGTRANIEGRVGFYYTL